MPDVLTSSAPAQRSRLPSEGAAARERCVLLVAPWFPPSALPPAHRARLFARHLEDFGWRPVVVTVRPEDREEKPEAATMRLVDADLRTELVRALPARLTRRFGIGDLALRAMPFLLLRLVRLARTVRPDAICLLVPPWYLLLLAPALRRITGAPIVVDYIDPWVLAPRTGLKHRFARAIAGALEGWALRAVDGVFSVSPALNRDLAERHPRIAPVPMDAAPYGLEPADFALVPEHRDERHDGRAELLYIGAISASMEPVLDAVMEAIAILREREPGDFARLRLSLVGTTYHIDEETRPRSAAAVAARGLEGVVREQLARVPYTTALERMRGAAANLVIGDMTGYYAASKLMPMLAAGRPVVAFLEEDSEPARVLRQLGAPGLVCYSAADAARHPLRMAGELAAVLSRVARRELATIDADFERHPVLRGRTARAMTRSLAGILDAVADTPLHPART